MRVFLTGFMGSGKSFIGKKIAELLNLQFIDLDHFIEKKEGKTIREIFEENGEDYFRRKEKQCLLEMEQFENIIIATGGGTPCFFDNMEWMNQHGVTVFLQTPVPIIIERLLPEMEQRPLLKNFDKTALENFIARELEQRHSFYQKAQLIYEQKISKGKQVQELAKYLQRFFL